MDPKHITYQNMETFAAELKARYAKREALDALQQRVDGLEDESLIATDAEAVEMLNEVFG